MYWLLPIHGPVVVPALNDSVLDTRAVLKETDVPIPSAGSFSTGLIAPHSIKSIRPVTLNWTPSLLNHFLQSFLLPLRQSRTYSLSLTFSGPKPDPFIALPSPLPLDHHLHMKKSQADGECKGCVPVRPEAGDHLRVYCDAKEALSLRTWLNGIAIDPAVMGQAGLGDPKTKPRKLFERARLCLIGERGEVLMIA